MFDESGSGGGSYNHRVPSETGYRCSSCGNRTRFDVFESRRSRRFHHYSLGGELDIEEEEVLALEIEKVVCRWCGSADHIEEISVTPISDEEPAEVEK
jgi:transposase